MAHLSLYFVVTPSKQFANSSHMFRFFLVTLSKQSVDLRNHLKCLDLSWLPLSCKHPVGLPSHPESSQISLDFWVAQLPWVLDSMVWLIFAKLFSQITFKNPSDMNSVHQHCYLVLNHLYHFLVKSSQNVNANLHDTHLFIYIYMFIICVYILYSYLFLRVYLLL